MKCFILLLVIGAVACDTNKLAGKFVWDLLKVKFPHGVMWKIQRLCVMFWNLISACSVGCWGAHSDWLSRRRLPDVQRHSRHLFLLRIQGPARVLRRHGGAMPSVPSLRPVWQRHVLPLRESDHFQPDYAGLRFVVQRWMQPVNLCW